MNVNQKIVLPALFTGGLIGIFTNELLMAASIAVVTGMILYGAYKHR